MAAEKVFCCEEGWCPPSPCEGLRPSALPKVGVHPPKQVVRLGFCPQQEGAPPLRPRVTYPSRGKSPKARQGLRPWTLPVQNVRPHWCCAAACTRAAFIHKQRPICHFEIAHKSVLFFSPSYTGGHTLSCQSVARQGVPSMMLEGLSYRNQYR